MASSIQTIALDKLAAHPDNANKMSEVNFAKLVRNIERNGRYEPLVVRPSPEREECFQIINGEHRYRALSKLGYKEADCIVWDIDDEQTDILLATLNRLCGTDKLSKKVKLLNRLTRQIETKQLARFLPASARQIERLVSLQRMIRPAQIDRGDFANPLVFFVDDQQKEIIEEALTGADKKGCGNGKGGTKAGRRAAALVRIAGYFLEHLRTDSGI